MLKSLFARPYETVSAARAAAADHGERAGRRPGPGQVPCDAECAAEDGASAERRGEQSAGCPAAQAQGRDQRLEREQRKHQAEAAEPEERVAGHVQAVAEKLRVADADEAEDAEG
jgi:hypothetical protein